MPRPPKPDQNNWPKWIAMTDPDSREALRDILLSEPIKDYESFIGFCQRVLAEVLAGNIPPEVGAQAKGWGEMIFASLTAAVASTEQTSFLDALTSLETEQPKQISATWTQDTLLDHPVTVDDEGVKMDLREKVRRRVVNAQE